MTAAEARHLADLAEAAHDEAVQAYRNAERALGRSKSRANREAYLVTSDLAEVAAEACRDARDLADRMERREHRAERVAVRASAAPVQASLF